MKAKTKLGFILIMLFQILILVGWTSYNEISLAAGKEVVLQTAPVDPMDIFRGEYVQLRYQISTLTNIPGVGAIHYGDTVYVHLERDGEVWKATEVAKNKNPDWEYFIAGAMESGFGNQVNTTITVTYGIEQYFVPQGKGQAIQNARDIKVRVAINGAGQAFIKGLIVDGESFQLN